MQANWLANIPDQDGTNLHISLSVRVIPSYAVKARNGYEGEGTLENIKRRLKRET